MRNLAIGIRLADTGARDPQYTLVVHPLSCVAGFAFYSPLTYYSFNFIYKFANNKNWFNVFCSFQNHQEWCSAKLSYITGSCLTNCSWPFFLIVVSVLFMIKWIVVSQCIRRQLAWKAVPLTYLPRSWNNKTCFYL